jgi:hypothetical protein
MFTDLNFAQLRIPYMSNFSLESVNSSCPYCGEPIELLIDCSVYEQEYVEDCQVCCRPITVHASVDSDGDPSVFVSSENE